jgi:cyclopropane fatty-acyl-phospholipid synthase-like methyltransferase
MTDSVAHAKVVAGKLRQGKSHPTLGANLRNNEWGAAGRKPFDKLMRHFPIRPDSRVVEYGCGSLRVGVHFLHHLNPRNYFGLDVVSDFYEMGQELVGAELLAEKLPRLAVIAEASVAEAAAFEADFVYSYAVVYHIPPDDLPAYFSNLARITCKPGARLAITAAIHDTPVRYRPRSWAWPVETFVNGLAGHAFAGVRTVNTKSCDGHEISLSLLEFTNPSGPT